MQIREPSAQFWDLPTTIIGYFMLSYISLFCCLKSQTEMSKLFEMVFFRPKPTLYPQFIYFEKRCHKKLATWPPSQIH